MTCPLCFSLAGTVSLRATPIWDFYLRTEFDFASRLLANAGWENTGQVTVLVGTAWRFFPRWKGLGAVGLTRSAIPEFGDRSPMARIGLEWILSPHVSVASFVQAEFDASESMPGMSGVIGLQLRF